jgi:hypothetical protein
MLKFVSVWYYRVVIGHTGSNPEEVSVGCECGQSIQ